MTLIKETSTHVAVTPTTPFPRIRNIRSNTLTHILQNHEKPQ